MVGAVNLTVCECFLCVSSACWGILGVEEAEESDPARGASRPRKDAVVLAGDGRAFY